MKESKEKYWMGIAEAVATRSPDEETKVGAILVKKDTGMIVVTAYNGFVKNAPDDILPKVRPDKYNFIVHSEINLIAHAAKNGINISNTVLIITLSPCQSCLRAIYQAGITEVICRDIYRDHTIDILDLNIIQEKTEDGYYRLKYDMK